MVAFFRPPRKRNGIALLVKFLLSAGTRPQQLWVGGSHRLRREKDLREQGFWLRRWSMQGFPLIFSTGLFFSQRMGHKSPMDHRHANGALWGASVQ
jgi:hypothetical protein